MRFEKIYFDMDGIIDDLLKDIEDFVEREEEKLRGANSNPMEGKRLEDEDAPSGVRYSLEWISGRVESVKDMFGLFGEVHRLYGDKVELLTAVQNQEGAAADPAYDNGERIRRHTDRKVKINIVPREERKEYVKGRGYVLIDSNTDNLEEWVRYGGYAIQFIDALSLRRELYDCGILGCRDFSTTRTG